MQTFLPYSNFARIARCLDYRRLGKQRVEAMQILNTLAGNSAGWHSHPAVLMWKGYENALKQYMNEMISEWIRRGYRNTMKYARIHSEIIYPPWLNRIRASHRSNLLRKDYEFYSRYGWKQDASLAYYWPTWEEKA